MSLLTVVCLLSLVLVTACEERILTQSPPQDHTHHATTVCIEIRPPGTTAPPTKVCGPIVHGGQQQQQDGPDPNGLARQVQRQQPQFQMKAGPPCADMARMSQQPQMFEPMPEDMMPLQGFRRNSPMPLQSPPEQWMRTEGQQPPSPQEQWMRSVMAPPHMIARVPQPPILPVMGMPFVPPPQMQRSWFARAQPSSEETDRPQPEQEEMKARFESIIKECDEKTKLIKEKDAKIQQLMSKIDKSKRETEKSPAAQVNSGSETATVSKMN